MSSRKPVAIALLTLLTIGSGASGQTTFGVKGGLVSADAKWGSGTSEQTAAQYTKARTGKAGAAFLRLGGGTVSLQLEGNYTEKGLKLAYGTTANGDLILTYLEVPALIRLSAPGKISPYVYGGAAAGIEMGCKVKGTAAGTAYDSDCSSANSASDTTRQKIDFVGVGGAGLQFALGGVSILVEGRYALGLRTIDKRSVGATDVRTRAISFLGGIAIPLGK